MKISLWEIEPFNIPPVANEEAGTFMKHLSGNETFEYVGEKRPQSMCIFDMQYDYPNHCYAYGLLLSIDVDTFYSICKNVIHEEIEPIIKKYSLGSIKIEFGGDLNEVKIKQIN